VAPAHAAAAPKPTRKPSKTTPKSTKNLRKPAAAAVLLLLLRLLLSKNGRLLGAKPPWQ